ncbi:MAG: response regulator transcription factor [Candidatus Marinimicrobia bacterium]|nr:response regulator transcription factor [Candidatus Neomarinimicrobiota bacterium]
MSKPRAVIVDDERFNRLFIGGLLGQLGFDVVGEGARGDEAVTLYRQHQPDLLLLDINMPGEDGFEALGRLKAAFPEARVVMLTNVADRQAVQECARRGALGYILKSNRPEDTRAMLKKYLPDNKDRPTP